jgi:hypothetical protein
MNHGRPFTPATIDLGGRVIREIRERGTLGKSAIERLFGRTPGSLQNVLIYITEIEPRIAETDDGKLVWVDHAGEGPAHAGTINITEASMAAKEKGKGGKPAGTKGKAPEKKPEPRKPGRPPKAKA